MSEDERWAEVGAEIRELRTRVGALEHSEAAQPNDTKRLEEKVADLQRELEASRRVAADQRRIADELRGDRDAVTHELERFRLDLAERAESPCESCTYEMWSATAGGDEDG